MATSYFTPTLDMNAAMVRALNQRYGTTSGDLAYLLTRYFRETADYQENMKNLLIRIANGQEEETTSTSGGPDTT